MLTEETFPDRIEVLHPSKHVQVRLATIIKRGDEEVARSFHRYVLSPGADLTDQPAEVVAVATAAW
jgi:hypothetical protein